MSPEDQQDLAAALASLRGRGGVLGTEIMLQVRDLARAGITVDMDAVERYLRYPVAEASRDELRGMVAALNAISRDRRDGGDR